jgi:hypothetical protein
MTLEDAPSMGCRGCLLSGLAIMLALVVCGGSIMAFYDVRCSQDANAWIPIYPESEIIREQYNGIRPFGVGVTLLRLQTEDDETTVESFYVETQRALRRADAEPLEARVSYFVEASPEGGATVDLLSQCVVLGG